MVWRGKRNGAFVRRGGRAEAGSAYRAWWRWHSLANPKAADVRIFLFRAVRELLLNSLKHAGGSAVHITMQHRRPDKVRIIVADDGPGFDPNSLDNKRTDSQTVGLLNIRERVSNFGGEFHINSGPKRGTRITLSLPCGSDA
jgi:signal transduction histidine kinase